MSLETYINIYVLWESSFFVTSCVSTLVQLVPADLRLVFLPSVAAQAVVVVVKGEREVLLREVFRTLRRRHPRLFTFCSSLFMHTVSSIDRGAPLDQMYTQYALKYMLGSAYFAS